MVPEVKQGVRGVPQVPFLVLLFSVKMKSTKKTMVATLMIVMVLAVGGHVMQGEMQAIAPPIVLGALCAFVAWGRSSAAVIPPKAG